MRPTMILEGDILALWVILQMFLMNKVRYELWWVCGCKYSSQFMTKAGMIRTWGCESLFPPHLSVICFCVTRRTQFYICLSPSGQQTLADGIVNWVSWDVDCSGGTSQLVIYVPQAQFYFSKLCLWLKINFWIRCVSTCFHVFSHEGDSKYLNRNLKFHL
jgi:hypothetical protein